MNPREAEELSVLAPSGMEIAFAAAAVVHIVLFVAVVYVWARGRLMLPDEVINRLATLVLLVGVPVLGPSLVLRYHVRASRLRLRSAT